MEKFINITMVVDIGARLLLNDILFKMSAEIEERATRKQVHDC